MQSLKAEQKFVEEETKKKEKLALEQLWVQLFIDDPHPITIHV